MLNCDIYLFCLWRRSKHYWKYIVDKLSKEYEISLLFRSVFPDSIELTRKFYNQEKLVGGYGKKLFDIKDEFVFCVCKDKEMNNFKKLYDIKKQLRSLSCIKDDYNFLHSSNSISELTRQLKIIGGLKWQSVTFT